MTVELYGPREIAALRRAGEAAAATLAFVGDRLRPGVTTADIDAWVREHTKQLGGTPSQLGYQGFPAAVCTSRNHVVCHGIPRAAEVLRSGDIVNIDVTTGLGGFHGDTSATFVIGDASDEALHVVDVARRCRDAGIAAIRDGARLGDIGAAVAEVAERSGAASSGITAAMASVGRCTCSLMFPTSAGAASRAATSGRDGPDRGAHDQPRSARGPDAR